MTQVVAADRAVGEWQQPINRWQGQPNSIHTDEVAHKIGMRGGTIPGTVHLGHFRPIVEDLWGDRWWRTGSISMYYTFATTHKEEVRAVVELPEAGVEAAADAHLSAYVETPEGQIVCKGTLAIGNPGAPGYIAALDLESAGPGENRILEKLSVGDTLGPETAVAVEEGGEDGKLLDITNMYGALNAGFPEGTIAQPSVGFFGGTEIRLVSGPIEIGKTYTKSGTVVCVGASPKTEFAWVDSELRSPDGEVVAEMRHMTRWMKSSSPLWD